MPRRLLWLLTVLLAADAPAGENWTQFRGPDGTGRSDATGLPVRWGEKENVVWKTPIHDKGWSSPVVWGGQVWLTTARADGKELFALCVDRATGKILHDRKVFDVAQPQSMGDAQTFNSYASPTPAIEAGRVYVHFGSAGTACLETGTGKVLWTRRDLPCNHHRGAGSSPVLFRDLLILTFDGFDQQYLVALDTATGETRWKQPRGIDYGTDNGDRKKAFSTPAVFTIDGQPQLVSPSAAATVAYDPATGKELWKVYHGGMNVAQPPQQTADGRLILCTGDGGLRLLAVRPDGRGDVTKTHIDWSFNRGVPSRTSPLLLDDKLFMVNEGGILTCVATKTGTQLWRERVEGQYSASPIYGDGKLYLFNEGGKSVVGEPGKAWKTLAVNQLNEGCMATPAVAGRALFLRTKTHLYRIEQKN
jgi:outer membrane protein assembly factor BamB